MLRHQVGKFDNSDSYICYMPVNSVGFDLVLYECGYEKCEPLHYWGPSKRNCHMLHYCLAGKGELTINGKTYPIGAGDGFYFSPEDTTYYIADKDDPWEYIWVCFGGNLVKSIMDGIAINPQYPVFHDNSGDLRSRFEKLQKASVSEFSPHLLSLGSLYILLSYMTKEFPSHKKESEYVVTWFETILKIVHGEFMHSFSIEKLARQVGFSRTTLFRIFKKRTGLSPLQYIECLRVSYACELIKQNKIPLGKIANIVGYQDYKAFSKIFQKVIGVFPGSFLEAYQKDSSVYDKNKQILAVRDVRHSDSGDFSAFDF